MLYQRDKLQRLEFKASVGARSFYLFIYAVPHILRDLSSLTRDRIWALTVKAPSPKYWTARDFPGGSDGKASAMRETWVRSLGREDPLEKHYCLENPMHRGAW